MDFDRESSIVEMGNWTRFRGSTLTDWDVKIFFIDDRIYKLSNKPSIIKIGQGNRPEEFFSEDFQGKYH